MHCHPTQHNTAMSDKVMRAKMKVQSVTQFETSESLVMHPVCKPGGYPPSGDDEDNTFAKYSPSGELKLCVTNDALRGRIKAGDVFYVDFTRVDSTPPQNESGSAGA